ncbi:MAG: hypothetical protein IPM70_09150 [Proteobacteria bacterium]|nr:hypothetical protein [Pseudomonadota bacterium]
MNSHAIRVAIGTLVLAASSATAQQKVPFANGVPVAPVGLADQVLPAVPSTIAPAKAGTSVSPCWRAMSNIPTAWPSCPNGDLLFTERTGNLRMMRNGVLDPNPITGGPVSKYAGKSGGWAPCMAT